MPNKEEKRITEQSSLYEHLEKMSVDELTAHINAENKKVALAIEQALPAINQLISAIEGQLKKGGRLFYAGCGTGGRLATLDTIEVQNTYGIDGSQIQAIFPGGIGCLTQTRESREDDLENGWHQLCDKHISKQDFVLGFSASGTVLAGQAMAKLLNISHVAGMLIFSAIIIVIAVLGYKVIHKLGKLASIVGILAFVYMFITLLLSADLSALAHNNHFSLPTFLLAVSLSSSWQIAFCPYVSDYSRYLPRDVSATKTWCSVFFGTVLGTQTSMTLGVLTAAIAGSAFPGHEVSYLVGLGKSQAMAMVIYFAICFGKITFTTLNAYGSFMSLTTIVSAFRRQTVLSQKCRIAFVVLMVTASCIIALLSEPAFLKHFTHFLLFLLAFFVPWSAICLTDYYLISKGAIDIPALSDPQQRYGFWNLYAITLYIVGVLIQLPFIENPLFHGSLTWIFAGNDASWIIGWFGTGVLYYALRRFDRRSLPAQSLFPST